MKHAGFSLVVALVLGGMAQQASANCRPEVGSDLPNQIGHIILFSSRGDGPTHPLFSSEFWAISGPSDIYHLRAFPVRFTLAAQAVIDGWDWSDHPVTPRIIRVLGDGILEEDGHVWLEVREILQTEERYEEALTEYPKARDGICGSYFEHW